MTTLLRMVRVNVRSHLILFADVHAWSSFRQAAAPNEIFTPLFCVILKPRMKSISFSNDRAR